jgi:hypothetical protein
MPPQEALKSKNLRFMSGWDNSAMRKHHFDPKDHPFDLEWYREKLDLPADWEPEWYRDRR